MAYRIRFVRLMIRCLFSTSRELLDEYEIKFRAIPLIDTDLTRLFTQTYAAIMGLGRWHYVFSSKFKKAAIKSGWAPVTTSESITYKKSIKAFERVTLQTKLIFWNDRRFYLRQAFVVKGEERAFALVEGLLRGPKGHLNPHEVFKILGVDRPSPAMPADFDLWIRSRS